MYAQRLGGAIPPPAEGFFSHRHIKRRILNGGTPTNWFFWVSSIPPFLTFCDLYEYGFCVAAQHKRRKKRFLYSSYEYFEQKNLKFNSMLLLANFDCLSEFSLVERVSLKTPQIFFFCFSHTPPLFLSSSHPKEPNSLPFISSTLSRLHRLILFPPSILHPLCGLPWDTVLTLKGGALSKRCLLHRKTNTAFSWGWNVRGCMLGCGLPINNVIPLYQT